MSIKSTTLPALVLLLAAFLAPAAHGQSGNFYYSVNVNGMPCNYINVLHYLTDTLLIVISREDPLLRVRFAVGPNPTDDQLQISLSGNFEDAVSLYLVDLQGRRLRTLVEETDIYDQLVLNISTHDLPAGMYFLELKSHTARKVKTLIIQR